MSPFTPLGETARWKVLYELLRGKEVGEVLTYEEMADALDLDPVRDRQTLRVSFRDAAIHHEEVDLRAVDAVRNVGYRVVEAVEHIRLARRHGRKAGNQLRIAYSKATNVDLSNESVDVRNAFEAVALAFAHQMEINRRQEQKNRRMQKSLDDLATQTRQATTETEQRLAEIQRRLDVMERGQGTATD